MVESGQKGGEDSSRSCKQGFEEGYEQSKPVGPFADILPACDCLICKPAQKCFRLSFVKKWESREQPTK